MLLPKEENKNKWDFSFLYKNKEEWKKELNGCDSLVKEVCCYKKKLNKKDNFFKFLRTKEKLVFLLAKLKQYVLMKDTDHENIEFQSLHSIFEQKIFLINKKLTWIENEIKKIGWRVIKTFFTDEEKEFGQYKKDFKLFFKKKKHLLNSNDERLMAKFCRSRQNIYEIYESAIFADNNFPVIKFNGKKETLNDKLLTKILETTQPLKDQGLRKKASFLRKKIFLEKKNLFSKIYQGILTQNSEEAEIRKYSSAIEMHLQENYVNEKILNNLIKTTNKNLQICNVFYKIKKKHLKLKNFFATDNFLLLKNPQDKFLTKIEVEEGKKNILKIFEKFNTEFYQNLKLAFQEGKIDFYEGEKKTTGAYCYDNANCEPVILMNWDNTFNSITTLIHEAGHAVHKIFANQNQKYPNNEYPILIAETASITSELVLFEMLYLQLKNKDDKIFLLQRQIEMMIGTFFRQVQFSEFEYEINLNFQKENFISPQKTAEIYGKIESKYLPFSKTKENFSWPRITHFFYSPFYVCLYALAGVVANKLVQKALKENDGKCIVSFLKQGGSEMPLTIIKDYAKVNFEKEKDYQIFFQTLKSKIKMLELLLEK